MKLHFLNKPNYILPRPQHLRLTESTSDSARQLLATNIFLTNQMTVSTCRKEYTPFVLMI